MNINQLLTTQHVDYERDLENPDAGLDNCPFDTPFFLLDLDNDITISRPCGYCGYTDCGCIDVDSPYSHITARRGW